MANTNSAPTISIIIVNFNGRHLLKDCLTAVYKSSYPTQKYEVILVDNNSSDDSVSYVKHYFPQTRIVALEDNKGFAGGNIEGYKYTKGKYIVLLNNDTVVDKNWLKNLIEAAKPTNIGLVSPKLYFATPFLELTINSDVVPMSDVNYGTDFSPVGLIMENIVAKNDELSRLIWYKSGFYERVSDGTITSQWTKGEAKVLVPFTADTEEYIFTFHGYPTPHKMSTPLTISLNGKNLLVSSIVSNQVKQFSIKITKKQARPNFIWLIQNAGNVVLRDGYSKDRGSLIRRTKNGDSLEFYEEDNAYFNNPRPLLSVCGAGCLIKRIVLEEVGFFDEHYFMYYEDVDLSLRAWRAGWDIVYEPKAIVYHRHKATTGQVTSSFFITMVEKNHLAFTLVHFPFSTFLVEFIRFGIRTALSIIKASLFKFRDNIERYRRWNMLTEGRIIAAGSFVIHFPRLLNNKFHWMQKQKRSYKDMKKYLY